MSRYKTEHVRNLKENLMRTVEFDASAEREVVFMRGSRWPGCESAAPLHMSPPVSPGDFRLVVKVDEGGALLSDDFVQQQAETEKSTHRRSRRKSRRDTHHHENHTVEGCSHGDCDHAH